jgi:hypothetical protein
MKKWEVFREKRRVAIDAYIVVKKRQKALELMTKQMYLTKFVTQAWFAIKAEQKDRRMKGHAARLSLMMFIKLGRRIKKGGGIKVVMRNKLRDVFTHHCMMIKPKFESFNAP